MKIGEKKKVHIRWMLVCYDILIYLLSAILLLRLYGGMINYHIQAYFNKCVYLWYAYLASACLEIYMDKCGDMEGIQCYMRLIFADGIACVLYMIIEILLPVESITFARMLSLVSVDLLGALTMRMLYRYAYKCGNSNDIQGRFWAVLLKIFSGIDAGREKEIQKIKIAIIGAGRVGVGLAEELLNNEQASYVPRCFIDINKEKVGREIQGIPVWSETDATLSKLDDYEVQEIIFAIPSMETEKRKELYDYYKNAGYKVKIYDYPTMYAAGGKKISERVRH